MPLSDIFQVNVVTSSPGLSAPGFGKPLILGAYGKAWAERYREYADLQAVGADFVPAEPEYKMAAAVFAQNPRPPKLAIGRGILAPTQRFAITPTVLSSTEYRVRIGDEVASFVSDATALLAEIVAGLVAAINALAPAWAATTAYTVGQRRANGGRVYECSIAGTSAASGGPTGTGTAIVDGTVTWRYIGAQVTASDQATYVRVTAALAGGWRAIESLNVALLSVQQDHADPGVATDLDAIKLENNSWYGLLYPWNSAACILANAGWAEANEKLYVAQTQDTPVAAVAEASATDIGKTLKTSARARTALFYHPATDAFLDAAITGVCFPLDPGSETWKFKKPSGPTVVSLTPTQKANLDAKCVNYYYDAGGVYLTGEGKVSANEWIDVIRGRDALKAEIQTRVVNALTDSAARKIPYTDPGILVIRSQVLSALKKFEGTFLVLDSSEVAVPKAADVSAADKAARILNSVTFTAKLTGAIHSGTISGVVTA